MIGNIKHTSTLVVSTLSTTPQNVCGVTVNKGKWLVIASIRSDGSGSRIFGSALTSGIALGGVNDGGSASTGLIGLCSIIADNTTIYAKFQCESGTRSITVGGMIAIQLI